MGLPLRSHRTDEAWQLWRRQDAHSTHLGNDAAELWPILCKGQQVADGTANGVNIVGRLHLPDQNLTQSKGTCSVQQKKFCHLQLGLLCLFACACLGVHMCGLCTCLGMPVYVTACVIDYVNNTFPVLCCRTAANKWLSGRFILRLLWTNGNPEPQSTDIYSPEFHWPGPCQSFDWTNHWHPWGFHEWLPSWTWGSIHPQCGGI